MFEDTSELDTTGLSGLRYGQSPEDEARTLARGGGVGTIDDMSAEDVPRARTIGGAIYDGGPGGPGQVEREAIGNGKLSPAAAAERLRATNALYGGRF
jgi:hypothetical protein